MKTIKINSTSIQIFNDIRELPAKRYIEYQKHLLIDSGIGSTMTDVDQHFKKLFLYLKHEKVADAVAETSNLYKNIYAILEGHNTQLTTLACLVYKIGDSYRDDLTDDGLEATSKLLESKGINWGEIVDTIDEVKKK